MKGMAIRAPREYIALRRPRRPEVGLSKSASRRVRLYTGYKGGNGSDRQSVHDLTACRLFIMDESKPDVHSTPNAVGTRMR